jgi:SAM-dependent methyltransferase
MSRNGLGLGHRRHSPAAERNQGPILEQLRRLLPARARVLEIASGTGQHAAHFAASEPGWEWQPTDAEPAALPSIAAWCEGLANVAAPVLLDVTAADWPVPGSFDAVVCANMLHISPWATCAALVRGAARAAPEGLLVVYGPFVVDGEPTAPSNLAFDADLRGRDPSWGLRRLSDVRAEAAGAGWALRERVAMPANNQALVFGRERQQGPQRAQGRA